MTFKPGDRVTYFELVPPDGGSEPGREYVVEAIYPEGIPSFKRPMVKLTGKAGLVDASHCDPKWRKVDDSELLDFVGVPNSKRKT